MSKYVIEDTTLIAIGDAIRDKTGETAALSPADMVTAISSITGGGEEISEIVLTGNQSYSCGNDFAKWFMLNHPDKISTSDITTSQYMFHNLTGITEIPFEINFAPSSARVASYMFYGANDLEVLPVFNNLVASAATNFCDSCYKLTDVSSLAAIDFSYINGSTYAGAAQFFQRCYSLRNIPSEILNKIYNLSTSSYSSHYNSMFNYCYNLDAIEGLAVTPATLTSNVFSSAFYYCSNLRKLTFHMPDGAPATANWKNQIIDLRYYIGYSQPASYQSRDSFLYNSGRTLDKCIYNDETYAALKNDPDAYVCGYSDENPFYYSFYNHDSAVETINSLPDCSASGGTNTIKFKGEAGLKTDAGAINTLTEEEIAVATAKGWTVTLE